MPASASPSYLIASLSGPAHAALLAQAAACAPFADILEIRLDLLNAMQPEAFEALRRHGKPLLFTLRSASEGGRDLSGADEARQTLLRMAGPGDWIDWEVSRGEPPPWPVERRVISRHFSGPVTLADLRTALAPLISHPAAFYKLVYPAERLTDCLKARELLVRATADGIPLACFAAGEAGVPSRLLTLAWGGAATFGGPPEEFVTLPAAAGQLPVPLMSSLYRVREINPATALLGIAGRPVLHSRSPHLHNPALAEAGLDARYLPLPAADFADFLEFAHAVNLRAASVTAPFKSDAQARAPHATKITAAAHSANTLLFEDGRPQFAASTDGEGVTGPLSPWLHYSGMSSALVVGSGPAGRAAGVALNELHVQVFFTGRTPPPETAAPLPGEWLPPDLAATRRFSAVINATPVLSADWRAPLRLLFPPPAPVILEMDYKTRPPHGVYPPGLHVIDGLAMLRAQAEAQIKIFIRHLRGEPPPQ